MLDHLYTVAQGFAGPVHRAPALFTGKATFMVTEQTKQAGSVDNSLARKPKVFSGIQPSGNFHLGNYLGAIRNWVSQQGEFENNFCIVDFHSLSLATTREGMRWNIRNLANVLIASGIDPNQSTLFVQSDVPAHSELCWILQSVTQYGELRRMTQFKDKGGGTDESVSSALFTYPVLMAADILLYDAEYVPVGEDQKQHLELTRDIAHRFNSRYGDTFVVPKPDIKKEGARVMSLDDPSKKMSKSSPNPNSYVALSDAPDLIRKKIRRAVTDSGTEIVVDPEKPALSNLISIYAALTDMTPEAVQEAFVGKGYGAFKAELAEVVVTAIAPIQERIVELENSPEIIDQILADGAAKANAYANGTLARVRDRIGIGSNPG
jgi:tryptophanyl-tRNA synthetase